jgi:hypothetical protein
MATEDRDKQFENALARHLSNISPDSVCPDAAEVLAAYHECALSPEEMAHWKNHISTCLRCQKTLALVEQTESLPAEDWQHQKVLVPFEELSSLGGAFGTSEETPPNLNLRSVPVASAAPRKAAMPRRPLRWILPLGALAAAVIVWIGVVDMHTKREMGSAEIAVNRAPIANLSPNNVPAQPAPQKATGDSTGGRPNPPSKTATGSASPRIAARQNSQPPMSADQLASTENLSMDKERGRSSGASGASAASRSPSSVAGSVSRFEANGRAVAGAHTAVPAATAAPAAPKPNPSPNPNSPVAINKDAKKTEVPSAAETAEMQTYSAGTALSQVQVTELHKALNLVQLAQANNHYIVAPGEKHGWLLGDAGKIEGTADRGKTWKTQNSGVTADLTGGSATSDKVCWIAGKAGTILLTTDGGKHWTLISSPITGDLGGVHATDATHASIWDVPNRQSYETNDGGVTWSRIANE